MSDPKAFIARWEKAAAFVQSLSRGDQAQFFHDAFIQSADDQVGDPSHWVLQEVVTHQNGERWCYNIAAPDFAGYAAAGGELSTAWIEKGSWDYCDWGTCGTCGQGFASPAKHCVCPVCSTLGYAT